MKIEYLQESDFKMMIEEKITNMFKTKQSFCIFLKNTEKSEIYLVKNDELMYNYNMSHWKK